LRCSQCRHQVHAPLPAEFVVELRKELPGTLAHTHWRKIAISPIDPGFGEQKAQSGENACLRQPSQGNL
jgi:hypothetical protein